MDFPGLTPFQSAFLGRLAIDALCIVILVRFIYFRNHGRSEVLVSFFALNLVIFVIAFVLNRVEISLGAAFGLFAVFSMLRYRTEGISTTDMTYLFVGIAFGLLFAIAEATPLELLAGGALILALLQLMEQGMLGGREVAQVVHYDRIDLVHDGAREALIADLRERTGLDIRRVEVREVDFLRDSAKLTAYYPPRKPSSGDPDRSL